MVFVIIPICFHCNVRPAQAQSIPPDSAMKITRQKLAVFPGISENIIEIRISVRIPQRMFFEKFVIMLCRY